MRSVLTHNLLRPAALQSSFTEICLFLKLASFCLKVNCVRHYVISDGHFWLKDIWLASLCCLLYLCTPANRAVCTAFCGQLKIPPVSWLEWMGVAATSVSSFPRPWAQSQFHLWQTTGTQGMLCHSLCVNWYKHLLRYVLGMWLVVLGP